MTDIIAQLRELSEPWPSGSRVKAAIDRASKAAGITYWRAFDIWYGKARRIEPFEHAAVAAALDRKRKEAARNELHELRTRLLRLESLLVQTDPDFHRASLAANSQHLRALGGASGPAHSARDRRTLRFA